MSETKDQSRYMTVTEGTAITLILLHDENHPVPIAMFPIEQRKTADFIVEFLNKEKWGIPI